MYSSKHYHFNFKQKVKCRCIISGICLSLSKGIKIIIQILLIWNVHISMAQEMVMYWKMPHLKVYVFMLKYNLPSNGIKRMLKVKFTCFKNTCQNSSLSLKCKIKYRKWGINSFKHFSPSRLLLFHSPHGNDSWSVYHQQTYFYHYF